MPNPSRMPVKPATPRHQELHTILAQHLDGLAESLARKRDSGTVIAPEDVAGLLNGVKKAARDARAIGKAEPATILPKKNPAVQPAYQMLMRLESQMTVVRETLLDRLHEDEADPTGRLVKKLAEIAAGVEQAANIIAGRGMQS